VFVLVNGCNVCTITTRCTYTIRPCPELFVTFAAMARPFRLSQCDERLGVNCAAIGIAAASSQREAVGYIAESPDRGA
jgi:hypothetical protein